MNSLLSPGEQHPLATLDSDGHSVGTSATRVTTGVTAEEETLLPSQGESKPDKNARPYSSTLHRSKYTIVIALFYAALALYAWVLTCILTYKPIGARHYGVDVDNGQNDGWGWTGATYIHNLYVNSERYYRAARTIQSIVAVLTIPVASAICSRAAVIYSQRNSQVTMRQTMLLADKAWNDPVLIAQLPWRWRRYGSSFLLSAMLLNAFGKVHWCCRSCPRGWLTSTRRNYFSVAGIISFDGNHQDTNISTDDQRPRHFF
jgi:hypothetical protein